MRVVVSEQWRVVLGENKVDVRVGNPIDSTMGFVIRLRRLAQNMSQVTLAAHCGVTFQQVQKYESGANRISFSRLVRIAKAMQCQVQDLFRAVEQIDAEEVPRDRVMELMAEPGATELLFTYGRLSSEAQLELVKFLESLQGGGRNTITKALL